MSFLILRLFLAAIFALAGVAKFLDLKGSEKAFKEFGVPAVVALPASIALSVAEIVIAAMFLSVDTSWVAAIGASALLLLFIGQMIYQMARGNAPDCHCFGQIHSEPVGAKSIVRNVIFATMSLLLVVRGNLYQGTNLSQLPDAMMMQLLLSASPWPFCSRRYYLLPKARSRNNRARSSAASRLWSSSPAKAAPSSVRIWFIHMKVCLSVRCFRSLIFRMLPDRMFRSLR